MCAQSLMFFSSNELVLYKIIAPVISFEGIHPFTAATTSFMRFQGCKRVYIARVVLFSLTQFEQCPVDQTIAYTVCIIFLFLWKEKSLMAFAGLCCLGYWIDRKISRLQSWIIESRWIQVGIEDLSAKKPL